MATCVPGFVVHETSVSIVLHRYFPRPELQGSHVTLVGGVSATNSNSPGSWSSPGSVHSRTHMRFFHILCDFMWIRNMFVKLYHEFIQDVIWKWPVKIYDHVWYKKLGDKLWLRRDKNSSHWGHMKYRKRFSNYWDFIYLCIAPVSKGRYLGHMR